MKIYDTLIIGGGYTSVGYAVGHADTIICEEHQICDCHFYLPMRSFAYRHYEPTSGEGKRLYDIFSSLSLFKDAEQNVNGFECAMCKYIEEQGIEILLKCRVIDARRRGDGTYDVMIETNAGISHIFAKRIVKTLSGAEKKFCTVLFVTSSPEAARATLMSAFDGAWIEPAFYDGRYALHIPAIDTDENRIKLEIYKKWRELETDAKILYIAPVFYSEVCTSAMCDEHYENPIEAFEAGYTYAEVEG